MVIRRVYILVQQDSSDACGPYLLYVFQPHLGGTDLRPLCLLVPCWVCGGCGSAASRLEAYCGGSRDCFEDPGATMPFCFLTPLVPLVSLPLVFEFAHFLPCFVPTRNPTPPSLTLRPPIPPTPLPSPHTSCLLSSFSPFLALLLIYS